MGINRKFVEIIKQTKTTERKFMVTYKFINLHEPTCESRVLLYCVGPHFSPVKLCNLASIPKF